MTDSGKDFLAWEAEHRADDIRECAWPLCNALAAPATDSHVMGTDDHGTIVFYRRWACAAGHHYDLESEE